MCHSLGHELGGCGQWQRAQTELRRTDATTRADAATVAAIAAAASTATANDNTRRAGAAPGTVRFAVARHALTSN